MFIIFMERANETGILDRSSILRSKGESIFRALKNMSSDRIVIYRLTHRVLLSVTNIGSGLGVESGYIPSIRLRTLTKWYLRPIEIGLKCIETEDKRRLYQL